MRHAFQVLPPRSLSLCSAPIFVDNRKLAQVAWNFVNDRFVPFIPVAFLLFPVVYTSAHYNMLSLSLSSLRTTLCLQFKPQLIASAAIYLASKFLNYKLPEGAGKKPWWEVLDAKIEDLEST